MPTGDTDEEILDALIKNGYEVTNVHRFIMQTGSVKSPSFTALEFKDNCLKEILLSGLVFFPEKQLPFPLRGKNCQKLGHTERFCWTPRACSICGNGQQSKENFTFPLYCMNFNGSHRVYSTTCPKYIQMCRIARTASETVLQSMESATSYTATLPKRTWPLLPIVKSQYSRVRYALQTEMKFIRVEANKIKTLEMQG